MKINSLEEFAIYGSSKEESTAISFVLILILIVLYLIYKQVIHKKELKNLNEELEEKILVDSEKIEKKISSYMKNLKIYKWVK